MINKRFGKLVVKKCVGRRKGAWLCNCDCGNDRVFSTVYLENRHNTTCGCGKGKQTKTHGLSKSNFYRKWDGVNRRCYRKKSDSYKMYGGRGIKCEWKSFQDFKNDMYDSYLLHIKEYGQKNTTLERIDVNGNYCKANCRWATWKEQYQNRRSSILFDYNGKKYTASELSRELGVYRVKINNLLRTRTKVEVLKMIEDGTVYEQRKNSTLSFAKKI